MKQQTYDLCRQLPKTRGIVSGRERAFTCLAVFGFVAGLLAAAGGLTLAQKASKDEKATRSFIAGEVARRDGCNAQIEAVNHDRDSSKSYLSYMERGADYQRILDALCDSFLPESATAELDRVEVLVLDDGKIEISATIMGGSRASSANICQLFYAEMAKLGWAFTKNTPAVLLNGIQNKMVFIRTEVEGK